VTAWTKAKERRKAAFEKHAHQWPLEASAVPLNHEFAFNSGWQAGAEGVLRYLAGSKALYGTDWIARACEEYGVHHDFGGGTTSASTTPEET
jgi:hypothetical protein